MQVKNLLEAGSSVSGFKHFFIKDPVKRIELYGTFQVSIRFCYYDNTSEDFGELIRFKGSIDLENDEISQINCSSNGSLSYLCLKTSNGRVVRAGEPDVDVERFDFSPQRQKIISFYGSYNNRYISRFGIKILFKEGFTEEVAQNYENIKHEIPNPTDFEPTNLEIFKTNTFEQNSFTDDELVKNEAISLDNSENEEESEFIYKCLQEFELQEKIPSYNGTNEDSLKSLKNPTDSEKSEKRRKPDQWR